MEYSLDQTDKDIIALLRKNGRAPNTEIAKAISISEATVRNRIKRLIDDNLIQVVAIPNQTKLGFGVNGNIHLMVDIKKMISITEELKQIEEIEYIAHTSGDHQIEIDFAAEDMDSLHRMITERINPLEGVLDVKLYIIMQFIKDTYNWSQINS